MDLNFSNLTKLQILNLICCKHKKLKNVDLLLFKAETIQKRGFFQAQGFDFFFCKLAKLKKGVDFIFVFAGLKSSKNMNLIFLEVKIFFNQKTWI